jgi:hypothetical protein
MTSYEDIYESRACFHDGTYPYIEHLWIYVNGDEVSWSICDSDGNHDDASKEDADEFCETSHQSWIEYAKWVAEHGEDPIHNYMISHDKKIKKTVVARFTKWIGASTHGMALESVKIGRNVVEIKDVPKPIMDYLEVEKMGGRWIAPWGVSYEAAKEYAENVESVKQSKGDVLIKASIDWKEPRPDAAVKAELITAAKKYLKRCKNYDTIGT